MSSPQFHPFLRKKQTAIALSWQRHMPNSKPSNRRDSALYIPDSAFNDSFGLFLTLTSSQDCTHHRTPFTRHLRQSYGTTHTVSASEESGNGIHILALRPTPFTINDRHSLLRHWQTEVPGALPQAHMLDRAAVPLHTTPQMHTVTRYIMQPLLNYRPRRTHTYARHDLPTVNAEVLELSAGQAKAAGSIIVEEHAKRTTHPEWSRRNGEIRGERNQGLQVAVRSSGVCERLYREILGEIGSCFRSEVVY